MTLWPRNILSLVYNMAIDTRNYLYDIEFLSSTQLNTAVISVGNLTVGGTGKTPVTQMIINHFKNKNLKSVVVSRNYKAQVKRTSLVDIHKPFAAQYFGDEPAQLALKNPTVAVYVGPSKRQSALFAQKKSNPDVIIVDDGFQHRGLKRNLDIVLLDATAPFADYKLLPAGKARETFAALKRSDIVLITKANLATEESISHLKKRLPPNLKIFEVSYNLLESSLIDKKTKVIAFAGLARPESFRQSLLKQTSFLVVDFLSFPDHYSYTESDLKEIHERKQKSGAAIILTTEKDWIKIKDMNVDASEFNVLDLKTEIIGPTESKEFYAILDQVVHS